MLEVMVFLGKAIVVSVIVVVAYVGFIKASSI